MNKPLIVALVLTCCVSVPMSGAQSQIDDHAQIMALEQQFTTAVQAKDLGAIMKVYQPGSALFAYDVTPPREYVGYAAYRKDWQGFLAIFKGPIKFKITELAVVTDGTLGYGHSVQRVWGTGTDGKPIDMTVRVTDDYRKINGRWYVVQEHVSVPVDMTSGKGDFHSKP